MDVKHVPKLWVNLFSLTKAMEGSRKIGNDGLVITMSKGGRTIRFDKIFQTKAGYVGAVDICPVQTNGNVAHLTMDEGTTGSI